jgi:phage-related minor tail protein
LAVDQVEEFEVKGDDLLSRIKELIAEGNVRRVTIKNADGKTMLEIPLTIGVVGALIAPVAAAIGAVAALVTECTITVTREESEDSGAE